MSKKNKLLARLANKAADKTWSLAEAEQVLKLMGFNFDRQDGSHRTYVRPGYAHNIGLCPHGKKGILPCYIREIRAALAAIKEQKEQK